MLGDGRHLRAGDFRQFLAVQAVIRRIHGIAIIHQAQPDTQLLFCPGNGGTGRMGRNVFGCDICQDVCPWNSFATPTAETAFEPRTENLTQQLSEILEMDAEEFQTRFRGSPVKRAKLQGLIRNARIVLAQAESHTGI